MLTIVIKAFCVNVMVDKKPIYLNKHYFFQNKIYYLDKAYFSFTKIKLSKLTLHKRNLLDTRLVKKNIDWMQPNIKKQHVLSWSVEKCGSFLKHVVL